MKSDIKYQKEWADKLIEINKEASYIEFVERN